MKVTEPLLLYYTGCKLLMIMATAQIVRITDTAWEATHHAHVGPLINKNNLLLIKYTAIDIAGYVGWPE